MWCVEETDYVVVGAAGSPQRWGNDRGMTGRTELSLKLREGDDRGSSNRGRMAFVSPHPRDGWLSLKPTQSMMLTHVAWPNNTLDPQRGDLDDHLKSEQKNR